MNATERILDLMRCLAARTETDVVNALDIGAILVLGDVEVRDIVDDLGDLGVIRRIGGAE